MQHLPTVIHSGEKKSLQEMNAGNSAMFHLQPLTASTDRKGPLQHISSCMSLDLTVFALSSWVSCQPRGSGFDIKLIASVTQCVGYCEMLTPATCLILRRSCILQTTGSQEISEKWFCSVCVLGSLKVKRTQYIKNAHFSVCVCVYVCYSHTELAICDALCNFYNFSCRLQRTWFSIPTYAHS